MDYFVPIFTEFVEIVKAMERLSKARGRLVEMSIIVIFHVIAMGFAPSVSKPLHLLLIFRRRRPSADRN